MNKFEFKRFINNSEKLIKLADLEIQVWRKSISLIRGPWNNLLGNQFLPGLQNVLYHAHEKTMVQVQDEILWWENNATTYSKPLFIRAGELRKCICQAELVEVPCTYHTKKMYRRMMLLQNPLIALGTYRQCRTKFEEIPIFSEDICECFAEREYQPTRHASWRTTTTRFQLQ